MVEREKSGRFNSIFKDDPREFTEELKNDAFDALSEAFEKLSFVRILKATNASVENLAYFSSW